MYEPILELVSRQVALVGVLWLSGGAHSSRGFIGFRRAVHEMGQLNSFVLYSQAKAR